VLEMKWRLREGQGEAIYEIGVEDSGVMRGISRSEMTTTLATLDKMAEKLGATTLLLRELVVANGNVVRTVLVRKVSLYHYPHVKRFDFIFETVYPSFL